MRIERFVHIRPQGCIPAYLFDIADLGETLSRGGATVRVVGDTESDTVTFQVAYCSADDQFCRATGRDVATKHPMCTTPLESLPQVLQDVARNVVSRVLKLSHNQRKYHKLWTYNGSYITKYFKAKETVQE